MLLRLMGRTVPLENVVSTESKSFPGFKPKFMTHFQCHSFVRKVHATTPLPSRLSLLRRDSSGDTDLCAPPAALFPPPARPLPCCCCSSSCSFPVFTRRRLLVLMYFYFFVSTKECVFMIIYFILIFIYTFAFGNDNRDSSRKQIPFFNFHSIHLSKTFL